MTQETLAANVPVHTLEALHEYVENRIPPGGFLRAVLENNLTLAVFKADEWNLKALKDIVMYIHWEVPGNIWGSKEAVSEHLEGLGSPLHPS